MLSKASLAWSPPWTALRAIKLTNHVRCLSIVVGPNTSPSTMLKLNEKTSIAVTESPLSGGIVIRKDSIMNLPVPVIQEPEPAAISTKTSDEEIGILNKFMICDNNILQECSDCEPHNCVPGHRDDSVSYPIRGSALNRGNVLDYNQIYNQQGILVLPETDQTTHHEEKLRGSIARGERKVIDILNCIKHYNDLIASHPILHVDGYTSVEVFPTLKVDFKGLNPRYVTDPKELINRIRTAEYLIKLGTDPRLIITNRLFHTVERLESRVKMLRECGLEKFTGDHIRKLIVTADFSRVTCMVYEERQKFGLTADPVECAYSMIQSIDKSIITSDEKECIMNEILPHVRTLSINSLKVKAINKFMEMRGLDKKFNPLCISTIDTDYLDLNQAFPILIRMGQCKECVANGKSIELGPVFSNYSYDVFNHLLETVPTFGLHHVSYYLKEYLMIIMNTKEKIDLLASRLKYLKELGFSDRNISTNYQSFYLTPSAVNNRLGYWFEEMGQETFTRTPNSLSLVVNYELSKSRIEKIGRTKNLPNKVPIKALARYVSQTVQWPGWQTCYDLMTQDPSVTSMTHDYYNSVKVYSFLTNRCGMDPEVIKQKPYILLQRVDKVIAMTESLPSIDPDYNESIDDATKIDLIYYHLSSFKDSFILEEKTILDTVTLQTNDTS